MLKLIVTFIGLIVLFSPGWAQEPALIEFDFGTVSSYQTVTYEVTFKEPLKTVMSTCECVTVTTYKDNETSQYVVAIKFDPHGYDGYTTQDVFVLEENNHISRIRLKGIIRAPQE